MGSLICISDMHCNYGVNGSSGPNMLIYNGVRTEEKRLITVQDKIPSLHELIWITKTAQNKTELNRG